MDHRNLLCKVCLSLGQCRSKLLDAKGSIAWSKAAIAADPKYANGYSQLSIALQHEQLYEEALENCQKALQGEGEIQPSIPLRVERLKSILNARVISTRTRICALSESERHTTTASYPLEN